MLQTFLLDPHPERGRCERDGIDWPAHVGDEIRRCRKILGVSQSRLAQELGFSENTLLRWENGRGQPAGLRMLGIALIQLEAWQVEAAKAPSEVVGAAVV